MERPLSAVQGLDRLRTSKRLPLPLLLRLLRRRLRRLAEAASTNVIVNRQPGEAVSCVLSEGIFGAGRHVANIDPKTGKPDASLKKKG